MPVTRTQTFTPAKISVARMASARPTTTGSRARTITPAPTRRTTPRKSSSVDTMLSQLNSRPKAPLKPLVPRHASGGGQRSILGQFWDLAKGLPQGLVGFGKDVLTDAVAVPHLAFDAARGEIGSPNDYLPATGGMITSFKNTGYDVTHPQEFIDAYKEGRIVGKLVEDVGNVAIFAGGVSKALGAGAATGVMSAEEAAQFASRGAGVATGRTIEEAATQGVGLTKTAAKGGASLVDAAQFGGRELAEYTLPKRGLARLAEKAGNEPLAGQLQTAGNVVRKYGRYGEQAGNLPALPYQYAGRGVNRLAEAAGLEGGLSGTLRRAATKRAPEIMFRNTAAGQATRSALADAERAGTRSTRFVLAADDMAKRLKLTPEEGTAVLDMIENPYLGQGLEMLPLWADDTQLGTYLDQAYANVEADLRPTPTSVRTLQKYRDRELPPERLKAMDAVREAQEGIAQDRTQRALGAVPEKLEPGTPAEPPVGVPTSVAGEPPGVVPGRPIVGDTPTGLHPEQLGSEIRGTQVAKLQQQYEKARDVTARQADTAHTSAILDSRIYDAQVAQNATLPDAPDPRIAFEAGVAKQRSRNGESIARARWDQAQRALNDAVNEYVKLSEGGPSPAVERAGKEVDRLTTEVTRIQGMVERNARRVDAAMPLSRVAEVEMGQGPAQLGEEVPPAISVTNEAQTIRARAKELGQQAAVDAEAQLDNMTGGDRPTLPSKGSKAGGEYDWFYELDAPTRRRLQREGWMAGKGTKGAGPDVIAQTINARLGTNLSVDEAMGRWVAEVKRYWDTKAGKSEVVMYQVSSEMQLPFDRVNAAIRGRIADYGELVTGHITETFGELRDTYQSLDAESQASFTATLDAMLADPDATPADFGDLLQSFMPDIDIHGRDGVLALIDGMSDIREVADWVRGNAPVEFPQVLKSKIVARGEVASRSLGRLEGAATASRQNLLNTEAELARADYALATAEGADARAEVMAGNRVEKAWEAEQEARPVQGPKLAETFKPDTASYDPHRVRANMKMSTSARARVREGQLREKAMASRAKANRLRKSVQRYDEKIAGARDELSRSFQDRLHEDVNMPAATQLRSAVASGGKTLGTVHGTGDTASLSGVVATIGHKYDLYDDLVVALDDAQMSKAAEIASVAMDEADEIALKPEPLTAYEVEQVVNDVLRERPDVVLDGPDRTMLDDAIGRDTTLEDMASVLAEEVGDGRRLNSPYRLMDVIDAKAWNKPQETVNRIRAAFDRYQVRRANTLAKTYNQWSAAVPKRFRPAVQAGQRQIGALLEMAEAKNKAHPGSGDIYIDVAESTASTLAELVERDFDPEHLVGGRPAAQTSAASAATGGGLGQTTLRGQRTGRTGLRQQTLEAYARVEAKEASDWIRNKRNAYLEERLGARADSVPEVQEALAQWAEEHNGETMPPRTLGKIAEEAGFVPVTAKDVSPQTILVPKQVRGILDPSGRYNQPLLRGLARTNRAFKTWVLPFSMKWQLGNILGNVIQASVHGGVGPGELLATMNRIRKHEGGILELWRKAGLPEWTRAEIANHGLTMDEYRTLRGLEDQPPRTPIGKIARASWRLNEFVDNLTRSSTDLAALARGESTDQALQTTVRSLGDYSRMSTFERKVVREIIPFYAWLRHSTVATLRLPISSPARAAFVFHLSDVYRNPEEQGELFGSRIELGAGLLNLGTVSPLSDITQFINPGELIGPATSPTLKFAASSILGLDLSKMAAITRPDDTALKDPYGRPKTTAPIATLARNPLAGIGELAYQATQVGPGTIKNLRDYALGDDTRYAGTGYRSGFKDPRRRSIATLLRALNLPSIDQPPDTRS